MNEDLLELSSLLTAVTIMRSTQKEYFKTRDKSVLMKSKELEKIVDDMLLHVRAYLIEKEQETQQHDGD